METGTPPQKRAARPVPKKPRISHEDAAAVMRAAGLEPLTVFAGASVRWNCRCLTCGTEDNFVYSHIKNGTCKGCRTCFPKSYPGPVKSKEAAAVALMEAAGLTPLVPYAGTNKPWKCRCNLCGKIVTPRHHKISDRGGQGCRDCHLANRPKREPTDAVARMKAAGFEPLVPWPGSTTPWLSRCLNCDENCEPKYQSVTNTSGLGCRTCSQSKQERSGRVEPGVAVAEMRAFGLEPLTPFTTSDARWDCRCIECGETVVRRHKLVRRGTAGPCKHLKREGKVAADRAAALGYKPLEPYNGPSAPWRCRCVTCGRESSPLACQFPPEPGSVGCAYCSGSLTDPDEAVAFMLRHGVRPLTAFPGRQSVSWSFECLTCGHRASRSMLMMKASGYGCRVCAGRDVPVDVSAAIELMREHGYEPLVPFPDSYTPWRSRCLSCDGEATPTYYAIKNRRPQRANCASHMSADELAARMTAAGFTPVEPYPGRTSDRWASECNLCHASVSPTYRQVMNGGGGASCCGGPFDLRRPGRSMAVYLVTHEGLNAAKIGIALVVNGRVKRVAEHRRNGWVAHCTWAGLGSLQAALDIERAVLRVWRDSGLGVHLSPAQMPQDGYTETVRLDAISLDEVTGLVEAAITAASSPSRQDAS